MGTFALKGYIGDECVAMLRRNWIACEIFDKNYEADSPRRKEFANCIEDAVNNAKEREAILVKEGKSWYLKAKNDRWDEYNGIDLFITDELECIYENLGITYDETYEIFAKSLRIALERAKLSKSEHGQKLN